MDLTEGDSMPTSSPLTGAGALGPESRPGGRRPRAGGRSLGAVESPPLQLSQKVETPQSRMPNQRRKTSINHPTSMFPLFGVCCRSLH